MVTQVFWVQAAVALAASSAALGQNLETASAVFLGALISVVSNVYFVHRIFGRVDAESPERQLETMFRAEVGKLTIAIAMFAAVFALVDGINVVALLLSYFLVQSSGIAASLAVDSTRYSRNGDVG